MKRLLLPIFFLLFCFSHVNLHTFEIVSTPPKQKRLIALTFDDGPRPVSTRRLQKMLARHGVPATFFVVGKIAEKNGDVVQSLAQDGHEIANHTWSHGDVRRLSAASLKRELDRTRHLIEKLTGQQTFYFRTPGSTENYLRKRFQVPESYRLVLWDVHSLDHERPSAETISERVRRLIGPGGVLLFHNGVRATVEALDKLIPHLKEQGYEFVTLATYLESRPKEVSLDQRPVVLAG